MKQCQSHRDDSSRCLLSARVHNLEACGQDSDYEGYRVYGRALRGDEADLSRLGRASWDKGSRPSGM